MYKSFKFRIYPTIEQEAMLMKTFGCVRYLYNRMIADKEAYYAETGKHITLRPAQYKKENPFLNEVDSTVLNYAERAVTDAYMRFHKSKTAFPKKKNMRDKSRLSYTTGPVENNVRLVGSQLRLPKIGMVKIECHREIPEDYSLKSVTVSKTPTGKYFASLRYSYEEVLKTPQLSRSVGLDFSPNCLYVSSDGKKANLQIELKPLEEKLNRKYQKLKRCVRGSKNHDKQRKELSKMYEYITNYRNDALRKHALQLAQEYDCIFVESLDLVDIANKSKSKTSIYRNTYGTFLRFLEHKLVQEGKVFCKVSQFYPSSKTCSCCGHIQDMPVEIRVYKCPDCGAQIDRDVNAAINIKREGERLIAKQTKSNKKTHESEFLI